MSELDLANKETYAFWSEENIRFSDIDRYNHLNNVAIAGYSENARVVFLEGIAPNCTSGDGQGWVIAKLGVTYLASAYFPNTVKIGTVVRKIGNASLILSQGMFADGKCFAQAENILVWADIKKESSQPIPDPIRDALAPYVK